MSSMASRGSCRGACWSCYCGMNAVLSRSGTQRNPGRLFWGCGKWPTSNCGFFRWATGNEQENWRSISGSSPSYKQALIGHRGGEGEWPGTVEDNGNLPISWVTVVKIAVGSLVVGIAMGFVLGRL